MSQTKRVAVKQQNPKTNNTLIWGSPSAALNNSCQTSLDWMEEEMARVCGEGSEDKSSISSPALPTEPSENSVDQNSHNNNNNNSTKPVLENIKPSPIKNSSSVLNWRLLRKKNEAELEKKLKKIEMNGGSEKRARLERRFTELFGPDDVPCSGLTGKRKDREEIAALTVKHLMPMYKKQKIASKELFKKLAKHISNCIMEKVEFPGENDVQNRVQKLFVDGKKITSEDEISSL